MNPHNTPTSASDLRWPAMRDVSPPKPGIVQVLCSLLRCEPDMLSELESGLSAEEALRAARFRTEELRHRFIVTRAVLRSVLGRCLAVAPAQVRFAANATGKPHLAEGRGISFNLAHTGDVMLLAVTSGIPVGVDVERIRSLNDAFGIADRFFTSREAAWLRSKQAATIDRAFFSLWTRKEAILKATGEGIGSGLDTLELLKANGRFHDTVTRHQKDSEITAWSLTELEPGTVFIGALALPVSAGTIHLQTGTFQPA
jgi:4'-phosphopantetheinyl transferase